MQKIIAIVTIIVTATCTQAAEDIRKYDPEALAAAIAPFIDEQTILVGHVDLDRIDLDAAAGAFTRQIVPALGDQKGQLQLVRQIPKMLEAPKMILGALRKAGVRDAYFVLSLADIPGDPMLIVVPLPRGADERAVRGVLYSGRPDGPVSRTANPPHRGDARTQVKVVRNAVVLCNRPILKRVIAMKPHKRPELARAFAAAGDTTAQVLLLPTANDRRVIEELLPKLPPELGGGPSTIFTRGMLWASLGVNAPPRTSLNLTIQSADTEAAKAMPGLLGALSKKVAQSDDTRRALPGIDKLLAVLIPRAKGDRLTVHLSTEKINALLKGPVASAIRSEIKTTQRRAYRTRLLVISSVIRAYGRKHDGAYPADLEALVTAKMLDKRAIVSDKSGKKMYIYIRPPKGITPEQAARFIMVHEDPIAIDSNEIHVLFADHNVRNMKVDVMQTDLLKQSRPAAKKASK
jgi:hypothetical protein